MFTDILYNIFHYQLFSSVLFRSALGYLSAYFIVQLVMPHLIKHFKKWLIGSDYSDDPVPIMGGILLIFAILISSILWAQVWKGHYLVSLSFVLVTFGLVGFWDDLSKVMNLRSIKQGKKKALDYADKSEGISQKARLILEFLLAFLILGVVFFALDAIDTRIQIPFVPIKSFFPHLPDIVYYLLAAFMIVASANAVNMTDGLDTLATVPILTSLVFVGTAAYISGDAEWSSRLRIPFLGSELKEVTVFVSIVAGSLMAFLKFNSPPAQVYLGDIGSLGLGATLAMCFIFVKAELFLPIVGGAFVVAGVSSFVQLFYFKIVKKIKGRDYALKNRFFYRAPYHHHKQLMYQDKKEVNSLFEDILTKLKFFKISPKLKNPSTKDGINSKILWHSLLSTIWLLVISLAIFLKIR